MLGYNGTFNAVESSTKLVMLVQVLDYLDIPVPKPTKVMHHYFVYGWWNMEFGKGKISV